MSLRNLTVLSVFRNSAGGQAQRFIRRVQDLQLHWGKPVPLIAVYGDCNDNTAEVLRNESNVRGVCTEFVECHHGGPIFGSTEQPSRLAALSKVCNAGMASVRENDDLLFYVESDLIWTPQVVQALSFQLHNSEFDAVAPLVFAGESFYDIWGFRKDGERFFGWPPYHRGLRPVGLTEVDSVGSCFIIDAKAARISRIKNDYALVGFFEDFRNNGFRVAVDPSLRVEHPA